MAKRGQRPPIHLIIPTHTTRHLDLCLAGVGRQSVRPATVTVTCDVVDAGIDEMVGRCAARFGLTIRYVRRPSGGKERLAQVRNNAVRALIEAGEAGIASGQLLFLDGDTIPSTSCVEQHAELARGADMVLAGRIDLDEGQTAGLDADGVFAGMKVPTARAEQRARLAAVDRRARFQSMLRRVGLAKAHKPRVLGGHHSVSMEVYRRVNGHDEEYHTWGTEDDDFARRAYRAGASYVIAIRDIEVFHLYHARRAGGEWGDRENARRFASRGWLVRCEHGLENPWDQERVRVDVVGGNG